MAECTVNTNTLPRSRCCSVVTRSPAVHSASALLGTPTQSSRSQRYPPPYRPSCRARYCKHACDCVTTTSQRVQSRLAPSPTLASNDVRTGAPTHSSSTSSDSAGILRLPCTAVSETSRVRLFLNHCLVLLQVYFNLQSFSQQAPQALRV